jgi:HlyD family secretion protein
MKFFKLSAGGAAAVVAAAAVLTGCAATAPAGAGKTSTAKAAYGDLLLGLSADGKIKLPVTNLNFEVSGTIKNVYVEAGGSVKKGDLLAELDDTELRLALETALKNLEKAEASYDDAAASQDYSVKTELASYEAAKEKLNAPFDEYTYGQAIANAETALARRKKELAEALDALEEARAKRISETYALTAERRQADMAEAEAALKEAEAALNEAEEDIADAFDGYSYKNSIAAAETNLARKKKDYDAAVQSYNSASIARESAYSAAEIASAESAAANAEKAMQSAKNSADDAETALKQANEAYTRAKEAYEKSAAESMEQTSENARKAMEAAKKAVESARRSLEDARLQAQNAQTDLENGVKSAKKQAETAEANAADAEASLKTAEANISRAREAYEKEMDSARRQLDTQLLKLQNLQGSSSSLTNALYAIEEAKLKVESAENDLVKTRITAPIDGTVLSVSAKAGETASQQTNRPGTVMGTGGGTGVITLCDPAVVYLTASVTEGDITGLSVGQTIRVTVDALGEENISAEIYSISSIPAADASGIITYEVVGILDEPNPDLRDNMSAFLTFVKKEKFGVLLIPNKAVFVEDGRQYVNVETAEGVYEKRAVTGGLSNGTQTEIADGLSAGETVAVGSVKS